MDLENDGQMESASMAIEQLLLAYAKGEAGDSHVEWEDLDIAFQYAKAAWPGRYESIMAELRNT